MAEESKHVQLKAEADEAASIRMNLIETQTQVETESAKAHDEVDVAIQRSGPGGSARAGFVLEHACGGSGEGFGRCARAASGEKKDNEKFDTRGFGANDAFE